MINPMLVFYNYLFIIIIIFGRLINNQQNMLNQYICLQEHERNNEKRKYAINSTYHNKNKHI